MALIARAALVAMLMSCRRNEVAKKDPTPPVDAHHVESAPSPRALLHGRIVDVGTGAVLHVLRAKRPRAEAMDEKAAFTLDADDVLCSFDPATGKERWRLPTKSGLFALAERHVFLAEGMTLVVVERATGVATRVSASKLMVDIDELRPVSGHVVVRQGGALTVFSDATGAMSASLAVTGHLEQIVEDFRHSLFATEKGFCFVQFSPPDHSVDCMDVEGHPLTTARLVLGKPTDPSGTRFSVRYTSPHHVVVGTWSFGHGTRRSAVVRLEDGAVVATVEDEIAALAERPDGKLEGLLVTTPRVKLLSAIGARWTYTMPRPEEFASVTLIDERLVVAGFNAIATGVQVFALNVNDGKLLWRGETKLPPIGHSKYRNTVTIEALGDAAIVRGHESSVDHVHVYDSRTGALRFSDAQ